MFDDLPNELLIQIVVPLLIPSDHILSDALLKADAYSPYGAEPAQLLLVCRRWREVLTEELYTTVVLRTRHQVTVLAETLSVRPELGAFIKRARLETLFEQNIGMVLIHTPDITHLALRLTSEDDSVIRELDSRFTQLPNLRCVWLFGIGFWNSKMEMLDSLKQVISSWKTVNFIRVPWEIKNTENATTHRWHDCVWAPLAALPNLRRIEVCGIDLNCWGTAVVPLALFEFLRSPVLKEIHSELGIYDQELHKKMLEAEPRLHGVLTIS